MKGHGSPTSVHKQAKQGVPPDKSGKNLFHRTVRGGFWVFALRTFTQVLSFARYIVLARVLAVEDIGLLGVAMLIMQTLNTFTQTGFQAALIRKKGNIQDYLNTTWTIGLIRAVVLFLVLYMAAGYINLPIFKVPPEKFALAIAIIRVIGLSFLLQALANVGTVYFRKELRFNREFILQISGSLTDVCITICIALAYRTVWSLVLGNLAGNLLRCVLSYALHSHRPRFQLDFDKAREMWRFGKWIFGGTVLCFLLTQGDDFFVWGYLGVSALAFYQMAFKFSNIPATEISHIISQVTFPALSKLQDDIPRLKDAYLKILQFTAFLSVPTAGLILVLAPDFVMLFLKENWEPIIPALQILSIYGMLRSLGATRGPVFQATGKLHISTKLQCVKLIILAILIYPLTKHFGITGTALALLLENAIGFPIGTYLTIKITKSGTWEMIKPIIFPLAATIVMIFMIYLFKCLFFQKTTFLSFLAINIIAILTYAGSSLLLDCICGCGIKTTIQQLLSFRD